jgi:hypothetical protein
MKHLKIVILDKSIQGTMDRKLVFSFNKGANILDFFWMAALSQMFIKKNRRQNR